MAYDKKKLVSSDTNITGLNRSFEYFSSDTVTTAGYFPSDGDLKAGDKVTKVNITLDGDGLVSSRVDTAYYLKDDSDGVLTATAFA